MPSSSWFSKWPKRFTNLSNKKGRLGFKVSGLKCPNRAMLFGGTPCFEALPFVRLLVCPVGFQPHQEPPRVLLSLLQGALQLAAGCRRCRTPPPRPWTALQRPPAPPAGAPPAPPLAASPLRLPRCPCIVALTCCVRCPCMDYATWRAVPDCSYMLSLLFPATGLLVYHPGTDVRRLAHCGQAAKPKIIMIRTAAHRSSVVRGCGSPS